MYLDERKELEREEDEREISSHRRVDLIEEDKESFTNCSLAD